MATNVQQTMNTRGINSNVHEQTKNGCTLDPKEMRKSYTTEFKLEFYHENNSLNDWTLGCRRDKIKSRKTLKHVTHTRKKIESSELELPMLAIFIHT